MSHIPSRIFPFCMQTVALNPLVLDPHIPSPFLHSATAETRPSPYVLSACPYLSHYHAPRANHPSATTSKHSYTTHSRGESWSLKEKEKKHVRRERKPYGSLGQNHSSNLTHSSPSTWQSNPPNWAESPCRSLTVSIKQTNKPSLLPKQTHPSPHKGLSRYN